MTMTSEMLVEFHNYMYENFPRVPFTKGESSREVAWSDMSLHTLAFHVWHGLKQRANDPKGGKDVSLSEKRAAFDKTIDAAEANELRATRVVDVFERELKTLAVMLAKKRAEKEHFKLTPESFKGAKFQGWITELKNDPRVIKRAEERVKDLELLDEPEVDENETEE